MANLLGQSRSHYPSFSFILQLEVCSWIAAASCKFTVQFTKTVDGRLSPETSFLISPCVDIFVTSWRKGSEAGSGLVRSLCKFRILERFSRCGSKVVF